MRYRLLPYWYTAFKHGNTYGCPVARHPSFGWPSDPTARGVYTSWLIGDALLITPVLHDGVNEVTGYVPQGLWYDIWDSTEVDASGGGRNITFSAPMGHVPAHVQGGHVIPLQEPGMTTQETWGNPLTLLVALPSPGVHGGEGHRCETDGPVQAPLGGARTAWGQMYRDEGDNILMDEEHGGYLNFFAKVEPDGSGSISAFFSSSGAWVPNRVGKCPEALVWPELAEVRVLGLSEAVDPSTVVWEVDAVSHQVEMKAPIVVSSFNPKQVAYDKKKHILTIAGFNSYRLTCPKGFRITWQLSPFDHSEL
eukprot:jgi/Botrbrau1/5639/Bobra.55_1s0028.2